VKRWMEQRQQARLTALRAQHERLTRVVNILLEKANEVDQEILYLGTTLPIPETAKLARACSNLVMLSESLPAIDELLVRQEVGKSRDAMLSSCRIAVSIRPRGFRKKHRPFEGATKLGAKNLKF
jgi:hypothetical protein